jgi:hypothetical protein
MRLLLYAFAVPVTESSDLARLTGPNPLSATTRVRAAGARRQRLQHT